MRILLAGGLLLTSGLLSLGNDLPKSSQNAQVWKNGPQGLDQTVGEVWFSVRQSRGDKILMSPLIPVNLLFTRTRGEDNSPNGLIKCTVVNRAFITGQPPDLMSVSLTVAQCPGPREYIVDEVIFETTKKGRE